MSRSNILVSVAALLFVEPSLAQTPPVQTSPAEPDVQVIAYPTRDKMNQAYPDKAQRSEVTGFATFNCAIAADGSLADCHVVSEEPPGYRFGKAALSLSSYFRFKTVTADGRSAVGLRTTQRLTFTLK